MKLDSRSKNLLAITKSKAKMYEFGINEKHHIELPQDPQNLLLFTIGILGELCAFESRSNKNNIEYKQQLKSQLISVAQYFDTLNLSKVISELSNYLKLVGAAAYYLADMPGSASVLSKDLDYGVEELTSSYLEGVLVWVLKSNVDFAWYHIENNYLIEELETFVGAYRGFFSHENGSSLVVEATLNIKNKVYVAGSDRELLFADILVALVNRKINNSSIVCLPQYTGIGINDWMSTLQKSEFIKEFWPAQKLLGEQGVFSGVSAVVQMPTSAGKTKSTELIIRSAFLSGRAKLAVVVAPFRALCREISATFEKVFESEPITINELRDIAQIDETESEFLKFLLGEKFHETHEHSIIISTPEKLVYLLRHEPQLASEIGLLIFDEGHQFDTGKRGVTYELLLAFLKTSINEGSQKVLISAVMANAESIGEWLNGESGVGVQGNQCIPNIRSIAFTSWQSKLGQLRYIDPESSTDRGFYVPRVIEQINLGKKGREKNDRLFPEKNDNSSMAAYLGVKLCHQGPVAVFCGVKSTVTTISELLVNYYHRGLKIPSPSSSSDQLELDKIAALAELHFSTKTIFVESIKLGILPHSSNIPNGLRVSVEWAMEENKGRFVVCTSTLAQGVNLPIKYLVISNTFQAGREISTRDFHNLIGRAGRSGYHTEGSIIFADANVYDKRADYNEGWRWKRANYLLDFMNAEDCLSSLKDLISPFFFDEIQTTTIDYIANSKSYRDTCIELSVRHSIDITLLLEQMDYKDILIRAVESYFLSYLKDNVDTDISVFVELAEQTLAYFLSNDEDRALFIKAFELIAEKVTRIDKQKYAYYGKALLGVDQLLTIETWINNNEFELELCNTPEDILSVCWSLIVLLSDNKLIKNIKPTKKLIDIAKLWISGVSYHELLNFMVQNSFFFLAKTQHRKINMDHVIEFTDNTLGFDGMLFIGALADLLEGRGFGEELIEKVRLLQSRLKFGLSSNLELWLYHKGYVDREICKLISKKLVEHGVDLNNFNFNILDLFNDEISQALADFPTYFGKINLAS